MAQTIIILLNSILISYLSLTSLLCMSKSPVANPTNTNNATGFTLDLIHRDSLQSPHHDPSLSHTQTVVNAIRRSLDRIQSLNEGHSQYPETDIVRSVHTGDYLMKYSIGHKPVPSLGIMDTGSDLIWTQCYPCKHCLKQTPPLFQPSQSSTYSRINCSNFACNMSTHTSCGRRTKGCFYSVIYGDGTSSKGRLSTDTLILASSDGTSSSFPSIVFGCGYRNNGTFYGQESGIVGLGRGNHSLVAQLGTYAKGKFSYCLVSRSHKWKTLSKLNFGDNADLSGEGVVSTPLVHRVPNNFYFVNLLGFSVGDQSSDNESLFGSIGEGNMILDSGTTITMLPTDIYNLLKSFVQKEFSYFPNISDPMGLLDLCFDTQGSKVTMPTVTFHFQGGDVKFETENMFVKTSWKTLCLGVLAEGGGRPGILGYFAQSSFIVAYDLEKELVYFKPTDCTKL